MSDSTAAAASAGAAASASTAQPAAAAAAAPAATIALAPQTSALHKSPAIKALAPLPQTATSAAQSSSTAADSEDAAAAAATAGGAPPSLTLSDESGPAASASAGASAEESAAPRPEHPLHQSWTFWYDVSDGKPKEWGQSLRKLIEINSVETFWVRTTAQRSTRHRPGEDEEQGAPLHCNASCPAGNAAPARIGECPLRRSDTSSFLALLCLCVSGTAFAGHDE